MEKKFSHLDNKGNARIVDISKKKKSSRFARAEATVWLSKNSFNDKNDEFKKGNVINVARIAGIMGAKQTSNLIPLCHNISLESSEIKFRFLEEGLEIVSTVQSEEKTGVEMEALTAVTISALTIYDMVKGVDKSVYIKNISLLEKKGGKTGDYKKIKDG
ncbi:MAG: cyclic pyranopterin monophosphate synthase accessory protein [Paracoccaceae bacterium]|nr:MAG: cyclic pyranopterin monophosphate synthase accessory protein [Paracoccaceae bacterium]